MRHVWLLAATVVVVGCTSPKKSATARYYESASPEKLYAVLHRSVKSGDALGDVADALEPDFMVLQFRPARTIAAQKRIAERHPEQMPDGVQDSDYFLAIPIEPNGCLYLQVRDGKLVNFNPEHYREYVPLQSSYGVKPRK